MFKKVLIISVVSLFLGIAVFLGMTEQPLVDAVAQLEQARIYIDREQYEQAKAIYNSLLANPPDKDTEALAHGGLIVIDAYEGNVEVAASSADEFMFDYFSDETICSGEFYIADAFCSDVADAFCSTGNADKAKELFTHILETYPALELLAKVGLIKADIVLGNIEQADSDVDNLLSVLPAGQDISGPLMGIADYYRGEEEYDSARRVYEFVIDTWPECEEARLARNGLIQSNIMLGNIEQANSDVNDLLSSLPAGQDFSAPLMETADYYIEADKYDLNRKLYQFVIEKWPDSEVAIWSQAGLAACNISLGDDPNAQAVIDKLIADFNDHPGLPKAISDIEEAYYIRILAAETWVRENYLNPVIIWEKVISKFPDFFHPDPDLYYFIADCYRQLGEYEKAIQCYDIVAANWTQNGYAVLSNAVVPRAEDDAAGVYEALRETIDDLIADFGDHPGLVGVITRSGHGYRRRANDARREGLSTEAEVDNFKAIALYGRVINEFGSSPFTASANFFSALCYRDLGQWQDALDCCNRLLDNWPQYKYATWARRLAQDCSERLAG